MVRSQHIIAVCLVAVVGLLAYNTFAARSQTADLEAAMAISADRATQDIMAVPFLRQTGEEAVAIIVKSTINRKSSGGAASQVQEWHLLFYALEQRKALKLIAVRNIEYDMKINEFNNSGRNPRIKDLRKRWEDGKPEEDGK